MHDLRAFALASLVLLAPTLPAVADEAADEAARTSLRDTELAFAASVRHKDMKRFLSFITDDAVFVSTQVTRGRDAVGKAWSALFDPQAPTLAWEPEVVELIDGGKLGLSRGPYWVEETGADGTMTKGRQGIFTSVWQRQADGSWKILIDAGCPPCSAAKPPAPPAEGAPSGG